jgi:hypothetical protein
MTDITNQSGGIDIEAESTTIGGDAVGRSQRMRWVKQCN